MDRSPVELYKADFGDWCCSFQGDVQGYYAGSGVNWR